MQASPSNSIKPSLREKFEGVIWKVETDAMLPLVAIEARDPQTHTAYFSAFDFNSGRPLFEKFRLEDSWNWGLDAIHKGVTLLHGYVSDQSPEHKGIVAVDQTGEVIWQQFNKALYTVASEGLVVYNPSIQPRMFELIDIESGALLSSNTKDFKYPDRQITVPEIQGADIIPPKFRPANLTGPVLHARIGYREFYAFHTVQNNVYTQKLLITDRNGLLLEDFLERDIQKLQPEAFFIQHNHLFCIRNKKQEFVAYLV
ncbi:DUF4905 domain-containing protein [Arcticibacter sp. MXS-1]|uniref:DUF4905 domain-containing protein n=1 Tax=Arcticibacter sp. MXS-1 TaxID=3341726 RepID=UPI0035A8330B